jgi:hypothetical protein
MPGPGDGLASARAECAVVSHGVLAVFRLLDACWLGDALLVVFVWDELGRPNLRYLTLVRFSWAVLERGPNALAPVGRGCLRYLLLPTETVVTSLLRHPRGKVEENDTHVDT